MKLFLTHFLLPFVVWAQPVPITYDPVVPPADTSVPVYNATAETFSFVVPEAIDDIITPWTHGSILFIDAAGKITQDNANFRYISGSLRLPNNNWHTTAEGANRFFFSSGSTSFFGSPGGYAWRDSGDANAMILEDNHRLNIYGANSSAFIFTPNYLGVPGRSYFQVRGDAAESAFLLESVNSSHRVGFEIYNWIGTPFGSDRGYAEFFVENPTSSSSYINLKGGAVPTATVKQFRIGSRSFSPTDLILDYADDDRVRIDLDYTNIVIKPLRIETSVAFEGATDDGNETTFTVTDPTADRTITLPDATGTVALTSELPLSGTFTPTLDPGTSVNVTSSSYSKAHYTRVGNLVTVYGQIQIVPTSTGPTEFYLTIPVASNFSSFDDILGFVNALILGSSGVGVVGATYTDIANNEFIIAFDSTVASEHVVQYTYTYFVE